MSVLFHIASAAFCLWIIFFGGAERLENTFIGYFEYGIFAESAWAIKLSAWVALIAGILVWIF